ncbi:MAG: sulfurtransferase TusA family protein [Acidiphilium sp.]|jgi:tRNA 2-thiouridine synthesizing protein A
MSTPIAATRRIDAGETKCGELLMMMHREMKSLQPGDILDVCAYSAGNLLDVPAWCRLTGHILLAIEHSEPAHFYIRKKG